jgi:hypothetical protein
MPAAESAKQDEPLPESLRPLFWDHDFDRLDWNAHQPFIIWRILTHGSWDTLKWLRTHVPDGTGFAWSRTDDANP